MGTMTKARAYRGPALFSYGFRPFFLFGAIYAGVMIPLWLAVFAGEISLPTAFAPLDWHVHEMLFGYVGAVIAGFLLTAVPNWTGRLPIQGPRLAALFSTWLAGRIAASFSGTIGWGAAMAVDSLFLLLLAAAAAREIVAGRKWGNLKVVGVVILLATANVAFHLEAHLSGTATYAALVKDERHLDRFDRVFGEVFKGLERAAGVAPAELPEEWLRKLAEKLLTYSLGRALEPSDMPAVRTIVRNAARNGYKFSAVIDGVVRSVPFTMRRADSGT